MRGVCRYRLTSVMELEVVRVQTMREGKLMTQ